MGLLTVQWARTPVRESQARGPQILAPPIPGRFWSCYCLDHANFPKAGGQGTGQR